jgi:hypothetical protein
MPVNLRAPEPPFSYERDNEASFRMAVEQAFLGLPSQIRLEDLSGNLPWSRLADVPTTFPPSSHTLESHSGNLPAARVSAGTFGAGNYTFPGTVTVGADQAIFLSAGSFINRSSGVGALQFRAADGEFHRWTGTGGAERMRLTDRLLIGTTANGNTGAGGIRANGNSEVVGDLTVTSGRTTLAASFSSYIADGLFNAAARPVQILTPSGAMRIRLGYLDEGGGQYWGRIGFAGNTNWSLGTAPGGHSFSIGRGQGSDLTIDNAGNLSFTGTLQAGTVPAPRVSAGTFGAGDYEFPGLLSVRGGGTSAFASGGTLRIKNTGGDAFISFHAAAGARQAYIQSGTTLNVFNEVSGGAIRFGYEGTERMRLTDRLLIGTTANGDTAAGGFRANGNSEVVGDFRFTGTLQAGTVPAPRVSAGTFGAGEFRFDSTSTIYVTLPAGVTTNGRLLINGQDGRVVYNVTWSSGTAPFHEWQGGGVERMRLTDRLLIGTTANGNAAAGGFRANGNSEVVGDFRFTGTLQAGTVPAARISAGTFGAGDYTFPSVNILFSGTGNNHLNKTVNNALLHFSGGNATGAGANYSLFGGAHATDPSVHRWRQDSTERMRLTDRLLIGTTANGDTAAGGIRAAGRSQFDARVDIEGNRAARVQVSTGSPTGTPPDGVFHAQV